MSESKVTILDDEAVAVLVEVLTYHYRKNSSDCGCGWAVLGASHPAHVADVFKDSLAARRAIAVEGQTGRQTDDNGSDHSTEDRP